MSHMQPPPPGTPNRRNWIREHPGWFILALAGFGVVALVLVAILSATVAPTATPPPASGPAVSPTPDIEEGDETTTDDGVYAFGATVRYKDGSTLTVTGPEPFTRTETTAGGEDFKHLVRFTIRFVNNSSKVYDPSIAEEAVTSGARDAEQVSDPALDLNLPRGQVRPGQAKTWDVGFGVDDPKHALLTVALGGAYGAYTEAIFTTDT